MADFLLAPSRPWRFEADCSISLDEDEAGLQANLISLNTVRRGECLLNVDYGTRVAKHLFEQNDTVLWMAVDAVLRELVETWEPRIDILAVRAGMSPTDDHACQVLVAWRSRPNNRPSQTAIYPYGTSP